MATEDAGMSDEALARAVQAGDTEAFGVLVERYQNRLLRYGMKFLTRTEDMQDIVQDVFVSAYQNIQSFDVSQKFSPWIYRIAHNAYVNALKKKSHSPFTLFEFDTMMAYRVYEDPSETEREQNDMRILINKGLSAIAPNYREVLVLYYLEELGYKEIAEVLHIPTGTVGIRLQRAKQALEAAYKKMNLPYG